MKIIAILLISILLPLSWSQAAQPTVIGSIPEGSTTGVTFQLETTPLTQDATTTEIFSDIVIDIVAAQQRLADQIATSTSDVTVPTVATSASELQEYATFLAGAQPAIQSLRISTVEVSLGYRLPAKLLFFIPIHYTAVITIDRNGQLKDFVTPGWLMFVQDEAGATKTAVNEVLEKLSTALAESTEPQISIYLLKQKQISVALAALKDSGQ